MLLNCKVLFLVALSLAMFWGAANSDSQENDVEKRSKTNKSLTTHSDIVKLLKESLERIKSLEANVQVLKAGSAGVPGLSGKPGQDGRDGKDGKDGRDGLPGKSQSGPRGRPGARGPQGYHGVRGPRGSDGKDGRNGLQGKDGRGLPGLRGRPGARGQRGQGDRGRPGPKSAGVQYVRWGRTKCPSGATLVYKGRVGGEWWNHPGGGSEFVCLTESPKYARYSDARNTGAYMYGAEYEVGYSYNPFNKKVHNHDVPCCVCYVKTRSTKLMIPATYTCPAGWTTEYWGYLMAERYYHKNNKGFVCVDKDVEAVPGTHKGIDGALMHTVEGRCGALPCPPYVNARELTCAMCTK